MIILLNESKKVFFVNSAIENIAGYTIQEFLNIDNFGISNSFLVNQFEKSLQIILDTPNQTLSFSTSLLHKNGSNISVQGGMSNFLNDPEINAIVINLKDISYQIKEENNSIINESRLCEAQAIAHFGSWDLDFESGEMHWSDETSKIFGILPEKKQNTLDLWLTFIHPQDLADVKNRIRDIKKIQNKTSFYHRILRKDGDVRYVNAQIQPKFNSNGIKTGLYGIVHDITSFKKVEESLKESTYLLEKAQKIGKIGHWVAGPDYEAELKWSEETYHIFGIPKSDERMTIQSFFDLIHPEDREMVEQKCISSLTGAGNFNLEHRIIWPNGQTRWLHELGEVFYDENKEPFQIVGIVRDITEEKYREEEKAIMIGDLLQRNKDLEKFAHIISHNLRAPVANIIGFSEVLKTTKTHQKERIKYVNEIADSINKLDIIIRDLNQILQVKREVSESKSFVLFEDLIAEIKRNNRNSFEQSQLIICTDFSEIKDFYSIKSYLYSIFYNLISNCMLFNIEEILPRITIKSHLIDNKTFISFLDNSNEIDFNNINHSILGLTDEMNENQTKQRKRLFIVKALVDALGGSISLKRINNSLNEFTLEFPNSIL